MIQKLESVTNWMDLCGRVREQADSVLNGEPPSDPDAMRNFASNAQELCDHVELVHNEMTRMMDVLEDSDAANENDLNHQIDLAAIETQRETHELRADPFDILKALLMWRDDPAERLHKRA